MRRRTTRSLQKKSLARRHGESSGDLGTTKRGRSRAGGGPARLVGLAHSGPAFGASPVERMTKRRASSWAGGSARTGRDRRGPVVVPALILLFAAALPLFLLALLAELLALLRGEPLARPLLRREE